MFRPRWRLAEGAVELRLPDGLVPTGASEREVRMPIHGMRRNATELLAVGVTSPELVARIGHVEAR